MRTFRHFKSNIMNEKILEIGSDVFCFVLAEMTEASLFEGCAILRDCLIDYENKYKIKTCRENVVQWRNGITGVRKTELSQKSDKARKIIFDHIATKKISP